jgi:hypothetical protein
MWEAWHLYNKTYSHYIRIGFHNGFLANLISLFHTTARIFHKVTNLSKVQKLFYYFRCVSYQSSSYS